MLKKLSSKLAYILIGIVLAIAGTAYAINVSVPQAQQKGDLPTGLTTGNYQLLHPGSDGLVLTSSSTATNGLAWQTASSTGGTGISSLNGLVGATQTFATGSVTGLDVGVNSSGSTHTITPLLQAGYGIPLTASTTNWNNLYNNLFTRQVISTTSSGTVFYVTTSSPGTITINFPPNLLTTTSAASLYYLQTNPSAYISLGSLSGTAPITYNNGTGAFGCTTASSGVTGCLSGTDWNTFNNKQPAGSYLTASSTIIAGGTATHSPSITFASSSDTNILLNVVCATATCTFNPSFTGTLAAGRLNSNVVQSFTNDTNVTATISAQNATLGWAGLLSVARGGTGANALTANDILFGNGTSPIGTSSSFTYNGTNLVVAGGGVLATSSSVTNASTTNLTATNFYLTGATTGCATFTGQILSSTGVACGSGGGGGPGGGWATTTPATIYNSFGNVVGINSTTPIANLVVQGTSASSSLPLFVIASSSNAQLLTVSVPSIKDVLDVNTSTPNTTQAIAFIQGTAGDVTDILRVASSSGTSIFTVTSAGKAQLPAITNSILATDGSGNIIATTTSAGGVSAVNGNGSILSSGGTTPTIQLQNLTANDILFGQGTNVIGTSSSFTFATSTNTLTVTNASTTNTTISGNLYTNLTNTNIPIAGVGGLLQNSSLSQSGGTTLINGTTPIIDGGGDWLNNVIQTSGANVIVQAPTSTAIVGNFIQSGGVQNFQTNTNLTSTQFCSGGLYSFNSSSPFTLTFPTLTQIGTNPCGNTQPWASQFAAQYGVNFGTAAGTLAASGTGETFYYAPGSGPTLYPGQVQSAVGQFVASSTIQGATTTGMTLNAYIAQFQSTSTAPTTMGQILSADLTGHGWQLTNLIAGNGIQIATSTANQITVKAGSFDKSFQIASTTLDTFSLSFSTATTTWNLLNPSYAITLKKLYCKTDAGTVLLNFGGNLLSCTSTGASSTPSTNYAVEADVNASVGTAASSPNRVRVTATFQSQ